LNPFEDFDQGTQKEGNDFLSLQSLLVLIPVVNSLDCFSDVFRLHSRSLTARPLENDGFSDDPFTCGINIFSISFFHLSGKVPFRKSLWVKTLCEALGYMALDRLAESDSHGLSNVAWSFAVA